MCTALPFWLSVHTVTFGVLPPYYRIAWASFAAVFWNAYMSHVNQIAVRAAAEERVEGIQQVKKQR